MSSSCRIFIVVLAGSFWLGSAYADQHKLLLQNNPFKKPEILLAPPPPVISPQVAQARVEQEEDPQLDLVATLVSKTNPMVIVNGELLAIGESIDGLTLTAVREGEAEFSRKGRHFHFVIGGEPKKP